MCGSTVDFNIILFLVLFQDNFYNATLVESKHHVPTVVLFYNWWAGDVIPHLKAYTRAVTDFTELGVHLKYAMVEMNTETQSSE